MLSFLAALSCISALAWSAFAISTGIATDAERAIPLPERPQLLSVTAVVMRYEPNALHDTFDDGTVASYDATELRIVRPEKYAGKFVVYHDEPADAQNPWKAIGATIAFRLNAKYLDAKDTQVFRGAVEAVTVLKKPRDRRRDRR